MAQFYRIVRVRPNGTEQVLEDVPFTDFQSEQSGRTSARLKAAQQTAGGLHVRVYSSDENGVVTPGDLIWDSEINTEPL
jgi:hypothetical protein